MTSLLGSMVSTLGMALRYRPLTGVSSKVSKANALFNPEWTTVRFRYHADKVAKGPVPRRHGYEEKLFQGGLLPRTAFPDRALPIPTYKPKNSWNEKRALFGQNDYIDILGPSNEISQKPLHPTQLLYHVPPWLRGVQGNEYQVLLRRRKFVQKKGYALGHPTKWATLNTRIKKLYRYLNHKTKSPFWKDA